MVAVLQGIPEHLLSEISDILDSRPYDTLFKLIPEPGTGCKCRCYSFVIL